MNELCLRREKFAAAVIAYCRSIELDIVSRPLVSQLVRSSTSIGANYTEAQAAISRKDFRAKVFIAKKECAETAYWLRLLAGIQENTSLQQECKELFAILQTITNKTKPSDT